MTSILNRQRMWQSLAVCLLLAGMRHVVVAEELDELDSSSVSRETEGPFVVGSHPLATGPFRDTEYGDIPHYGDENRPSRGYPHYDYPNERYGQWYRPRAFGLKQRERCLPRPFRPRGYGNLEKRPSTCYRMEYNPYVLEHPGTKFGPSYMYRQPDGRCGGDELISINNDVPWYRFNVRQQLHRVGSSLKSLLTF